MSKCECGAPGETKCVDCQDSVCDACVSAEGRCEACDEKASSRKQKKTFKKMSKQILDD